MGNIIGFGHSTVPDPATGLSPRDRYNVTSTWAILKRDLRGTGVKLMLAYFRDYPDYQIHFPFRDVPFNKLAETPKFRAHCANLIYALSAIIDSLDDLESMIALLVKTGEAHLKHKAPAKGFDDLTVTFVKFLHTELTFRMTDECEASWKKTVEVAFKIIKEQLDK